MTQFAWQLPQGFDELLPEQARILEHYRQRLFTLCESWGYDYLIPPFAEFIDVLMVGTGQDIASEIFQVADNHSDKMLGIRADMTPQVARMDARKLSDHAINRLFYLGTVLRATGEAHQIGSRAPFQFGAELYGHASQAADIEIIRLLLASLDTLAIAPITLDFGHVSILHHIQDRAELSQTQMRQLYTIMQSKSQSDLRDWTQRHGVAEDICHILTQLVDCYGDWQQALATFADTVVTIDPAMQVFHEELYALISAITVQHPDVAIQVDLSEFKGYRYHTGIVFAAFTENYGAEIARGGRYDNIGKAFGHARPATGFSADLKLLLRLGNTNHLPTPQRIMIPQDLPSSAESMAELNALIHQLRTEGKQVIQAMAASDTPATCRCDHQLVYDQGQGQWCVQAVST